MGWMEVLAKTYDACESIAGKQIGEDPVLLPLSHSTHNAQLEVTVDIKGNFVPTLSRRVEKDGKDEFTIIPVTEDSAARSNGSAPHALCDKLCYVAGDYSVYTDEDKTTYYRDYIKGLHAWAYSEYGHPWIRAVYEYLKKGSLITDLVQAGLLTVDGNGMLSKKEAKIGQIEQPKAFVRFAVWQDGNCHRLWTEEELYKRYASYYNSILQTEALDYITGKVTFCSEKHPAKLRNTGDKAKLISGNDTAGFTYRGRFAEREQAVSVGYETSQKAHNALRWLLARQGYYADGEMTVIWKLPQKDEHPDTMQGLNPFEGTQNLLNSFDFRWEQKTETNDIELGRRYAEELELALAGYCKKIKPDDKVVILSVDAATPGRLSITYYQEFFGNDFVDRLMHWHHNCIWTRSVKIRDSQKYVLLEAAPSPRELALAAFGTQRGNGYLECDDKLKKAVVRRILPCIIGLSPKIPADIVRAAAARASNPQCYGDKIWRYQVLSPACAMLNYNLFDGKANVMELEEDRSYLFGRLLAVMERMEDSALWKKGVRSDERLTNAKKLWNVYVRRPAVTYKRLYEQIVQGYMKNIGGWLRKQYEDEAMEISNTLRESGGFTNHPLNESYLLGYWKEREKLIALIKKDSEKEGGEA